MVKNYGTGFLGRSAFLDTSFESHDHMCERHSHDELLLVTSNERDYKKYFDFIEATGWRLQGACEKNEQNHSGDQPAHQRGKGRRCHGSGDD
jgi:hypothetical protein